MSNFFSDLADAFGFGGNSATKSAENDRQAARAGVGDDDEDAVTTIVRTSFRTLSATDETDGFTTFAVGGAPIPAPTEGADDSNTRTDRDSFKTDSNQPTANAAVPTPTGGQVSAESGSADTATQSSGSSNTAVKAGIAVGVLAAILIVAGLVWFIFMKRKKKQEERQSLDDDEKLHGPFRNADDDRLTQHAPAPPAKAPRVSLQRISLFSSLGADKQISKNGGPMAAAAVPSDRSGSAWERPFTSQSQNPANPFGNHAERMHTPIPEEPNRAVSPLDETNVRGSQPVSPMQTQQATFGTMGPANAAYNDGAVVGVTAGLIRKQSRNYGPQPLDLTVAPPVPVAAAAVPPSPALTEYSVNSMNSGQTIPATSGAAAIAAAGGPSTSAVHRVQLDFKPTLEDELELRAGDLVRLLHEYDDGWALVIRLDRSQQGVAPRTCLSNRPVKPRPRPNNGPGPAPRGPPPVNPTGRPMTPQGHPRPGTAQSNRSMSPPNGQGPRPVSPNQTRGPAPGQAPMAAPGQQLRPLSPNGPGPNSNTEAQPAPAPAVSAFQAVQAVKAAQAAQAAAAAAQATAAAQASQTPAAESPAPTPQAQSPVTQSPVQSPLSAQPRLSPPTGPVSRKPVPKAVEA